MAAPFFRAVFLGVLLLFQVSDCSGKDFEGFGDELAEEAGDVDSEDAQIPEALPRKVHRVIYEARNGDESLLDFRQAASAIEQPDSAEGDGENDEAEDRPVQDKRKPSTPPIKQTTRDEWDEDEFEGIPVGYPEQPSSGQGAKPAAPKQPPRKTVRVIQPRKPFKAKDHVPEMIFLAFLVVFAINYFIGSSRNEKIALSWAEQFTSSGSIFEKNFSLLGTGDSNDEIEPLMIKEGQGTFKFYASGRRYCECALATLDLRARHDLLSLAWYLAFPKKDTLKVEVHMNEDCMQPFILAVVRRKVAKAYLKDNKDLKEYCSIMDFSAHKKWPAELAVIGDCREAATELLNDVILDQILGEKVFEKHATQFVSLHFTDQAPGPLKKKILRFEFMLPAPNKMADISKLVASIPYFIDSVAKLTLSATAKAKAEAARSRAQQAAMKELLEQRQEELQRRREEKRKAEEAKLSPQELARKREKEKKKAMQPKRVTRIH